MKKLYAFFILASVASAQLYGAQANNQDAAPTGSETYTSEGGNRFSPKAGKAREQNNFQAAHAAAAVIPAAQQKSDQESSRDEGYWVRWNRDIEHADAQDDESNIREYYQKAAIQELQAKIKSEQATSFNLKAQVAKQAAEITALKNLLAQQQQQRALVDAQAQAVENGLAQVNAAIDSLNL
jgi:hypothetical protein